MPYQCTCQCHSHSNTIYEYKTVKHSVVKIMIHLQFISNLILTNRHRSNRNGCKFVRITTSNTRHIQYSNNAPQVFACKQNRLNTRVIMQETKACQKSRYMQDQRICKIKQTRRMQTCVNSRHLLLQVACFLFADLNGTDEGRTVIRR